VAWFRQIVSPKQSTLDHVLKVVNADLANADLAGSETSRDTVGKGEAWYLRAREAQTSSSARYKRKHGEPSASAASPSCARPKQRRARASGELFA